MKDFFQKMIAFFLALLSALGISLKAPSEPALKLSDDDTYSIKQRPGMNPTRTSTATLQSQDAAARNSSHSPRSPRARAP